MESELKLEVKRQLFHLCLGSVIAIIVWHLKPIYDWLLVIPLIIAIIVMLLQPKHEISEKLLNHFERKSAMPFKGAIWYGIGIIFPILLLSREFSSLVILILSVGDAFSTLVGKFCGKHRMGDKSIEGSLAFVLFSIITCSIFLYFIGRTDLFLKISILSVIGALIEIQSFIDDNFAVPVGLVVVVRILE